MKECKMTKAERAGWDQWAKNVFDDWIKRCGEFYWEGKKLNKNELVTIKICREPKNENQIVRSKIPSKTPKTNP